MLNAAAKMYIIASAAMPAGGGLPALCCPAPRSCPNRKYYTASSSALALYWPDQVKAVRKGTEELTKPTKNMANPCTAPLHIRLHRRPSESARKNTKMRQVTTLTTP